MSSVLLRLEQWKLSKGRLWEGVLLPGNDYELGRIQSLQTCTRPNFKINFQRPRSSRKMGESSKSISISESKSSFGCLAGDTGGVMERMESLIPLIVHWSATATAKENIKLET